MTVHLDSVAQAVRDGDRVALAKLLSRLERGDPDGQAAMELLWPDTGRAHIIGVTGAPGTGKSTLVAALIEAYRKPVDGAPQRVAVVAVDPSSPFSRGAILGDRIRMQATTMDEGVFVRSMASRGRVGGLAPSTSMVVSAFDAAGYDVVIIETVGAGQSEIEVVRLAHTVAVVESPGRGDEVQAIKAGILEIADVLVLNKADLEGSEGAERVLRGMLTLGSATKESGQQEAWAPRVLRTVARDRVGVEALVAHFAEHHAHLVRCGRLAELRRTRMAEEVTRSVERTLMARWRERVDDDTLGAAIDRVCRGEVGLRAVVGELVGPGAEPELA